MIHAVAPGLCSAALSKVSRENLPPIPIHYQIAIINALEIQCCTNTNTSKKLKYKYKFVETKIQFSTNAIHSFM